MLKRYQVSIRKDTYAAIKNFSKEHELKNNRLIERLIVDFLNAEDRVKEGERNGQ